MSGQHQYTVNLEMDKTLRSPFALLLMHTANDTVGSCRYHMCKPDPQPTTHLSP